MLNAVAHQSSMQELDLLNPQLDPRISYTGGPKWYHGPDGLLRESRANLATESEFRNGLADAPLNGGGASLTAESLPGWLSRFTTGLGFTRNPSATVYAYKVATFVAGLDYVLSVYVEIAGGAPVVGTSGNPAADMSMLIQGSSGVASVSHVEGNIYRISTTRTSTLSASSSYGVLKYPAQTSRPFKVTGWQLEVGVAAGDYIKTTTSIAYDWPLEYDPITLQPLGRSVWEQRTNLETASETLVGYTRANTTANASGTLLGMTAFELVEAATTGLHFLTVPTTFFTSGVTYTISRVVKSLGRNASLSFPTGPFGANVRWTYDLATGTATRNTAGTNDVGTITPLGGGVFRITLTATATASANGQGGIYTVSGSSVSYAGDGASGLLIAASQLEAGAFASPYIPTSGSQVTRVADTVKVALDAIRYNSAQTTVRAELQVTSIDASRQRYIATVGNNGRFIYFASNKTQPQIYDGTAVRSAAASLPVGATGAAVGSFGPGGIKAAAGGGVSTSSYDGDFEPTATTLTIGGETDSSRLNDAFIRTVRLYPCQLADSEHQALTA